VTRWKREKEGEMKEAVKERKFYLFNKKKENFFTQILFSEWIIEMDHHGCELRGWEHFRIFKPILKKGFESDPDIWDPNPQILQKKRSVTVVTIHAEPIIALKMQIKNLCQKSPKSAKFQAIFGAFYMATKIRILALKIRIFFLPQKSSKDSDL
jgi:hypothetical protein